MDEVAALDLARSTTALAAAAGAGEAAVTVSVARRFHAEARERTVSKLEHSTNTSLHLHVLSEGRRSSFVTSDLSAGGLREAVRRAVEQAAFVTPDPLAGLPERCGGYGAELHLYDPSVVALDGAEKVDRALELERLIREADVRVVNSNGSHYSDAVSITALANSTGFAGSYMSTRAGFSTGPVALDGEVKRTAHYGTAGRHVAHLESTQAVAYTAARRAVDLFGARKPPTMRAAVIFERDVAAAVIDDLFAAVSAANVAVGNSWLIGRTGKRVGSDLVTIVDDGRLPARLGSAPFDGEGVATQRTVVFERGVLQSFLYDT
jgi:PmbA protein